MPAIAKTNVSLLTGIMSHGDDSFYVSGVLLPSLSVPFWPVPITVSTSCFNMLISRIE